MCGDRPHRGPADQDAAAPRKAVFVLNPSHPSGSTMCGGLFNGGSIMTRFANASLIAAAFVVATSFANPSDAATKKHVVKHQVVADRDSGAPVRYSGVPANYYPAPPFPFFLVPGPWWLPAHP
jgi:hypothetical protein